MSKSPKTRPVWPMNEGQDPIDWPLAHPSTLSEDAQTIYRYADSGRPLSRDYLDPKARRSYISREEQDAYQPSERVLAAIKELKAVGLAEYKRKDGFLYIHRVSEHYTVAEGRGSQLIRAYLTDEGTLGKVLLGVFVGGDIESRDNRSEGMPEVTVRVRHATATDVEHDAASTAQLVIASPTFPVFSGYGRVTFKGFLTEASLYPLGTDPLTQEGFDPSELCDQCEEPHPYAPYFPPKVQLPLTSKGTVVEIVCLPLRPYLVAD